MDVFNDFNRIWNDNQKLSEILIDGNCLTLRKHIKIILK